MKINLLLLTILISIASNIFGQTAGENSNTTTNGDWTQNADVEAFTVKLDPYKDKALIQSEYNRLIPLGMIHNQASSGGAEIKGEFSFFTTQGFFNHFYGNDHYTAAFDTVVGQIKNKFIIPFAGLLFFMSCLINYYGNVIKGKNSFEWAKFSRDAWILFFLFSYVLIMQLLTYITNIFPILTISAFDAAVDENIFVQFKMLVMDPEVSLEKYQMEQVLKIAYAHDKGTDMLYNRAVLNAMITKIGSVEQELSMMDSLTYHLRRLLNIVMHLPGNSINNLVTIFSVVAKFVIMALSYAIDKILYVLGPLALLLAYVPAFKDKWITWLSTWLTVKLNFLTLIVIDGTLTIVQSTEGMQDIYNQTLMSPDITIAFNIIAIVLYICSFWLTSQWIGSADAGKFLSTVASVGMAAAGMKMMSKGGGAAASQSAGQGLGDAAHIGGNAAGGQNPNNDRV